MLDVLDLSRDLYSTPMDTTASYTRARAAYPLAILPMPYEPIVRIGGLLTVRASNGVEEGHYVYSHDVFYSDHDTDNPITNAPTAGCAADACDSSCHRCA